MPDRQRLAPVAVGERHRPLLRLRRLPARAASAACSTSAASTCGSSSSTTARTTTRPRWRPASPRPMPRVEVRRHPENRGHIATYNEGLAWADRRLRGAGVGRRHGDPRRLRPRHRHHGRPGGCRPRLRPALLRAVRRAHADAHRAVAGHRRSGTAAAGSAGAAARATTASRRPRSSCAPRSTGRSAATTPSCPHSGDLELWLRIAAVSDVAYVRGVPQAIYRVHPRSMLRSRYADPLVDLRHRKAAFDSFFARSGPVEAFARDRAAGRARPGPPGPLAGEPGRRPRPPRRGRRRRPGRVRRRGEPGRPPAAPVARPAGSAGRSVPVARSGSRRCSSAGPPTAPATRSATSGGSCGGSDPVIGRPADQAPPRQGAGPSVAPTLRSRVSRGLAWSTVNTRREPDRPDGRGHRARPPDRPRAVRRVRRGPGRAERRDQRERAGRQRRHRQGP